MAKKSKQTKAEKKPVNRALTERKGKVAWVKEQLKALPGWPHLKVKDWKQIVVDHYKPRHGLTSRHPTYLKYSRFISNAKFYGHVKASKKEPVEQEGVEDEAQLGMVEAELVEEQLDDSGRQADVGWREVCERCTGLGVPGNANEQLRKLTQENEGLRAQVKELELQLSYLSIYLILLLGVEGGGGEGSISISLSIYLYNPITRS